MNKAMRSLVICLASLFCFLAFASGCDAGKTTKLKGEEVVLDRNMENGVGVLGKVSIEDLGNVTYNFRYMNTVPENAVIMWRLGQWGTEFGLADTGKESKEGDDYILKDNTKEFIVNPKTGRYSLNCDTTDEYEKYNGVKPYGADWLHLITIQNLADISRVAEMKNIYADFEFSIDYCENLMGGKLDLGLHTALFQWVFVVKNDNPDSPDYNQYFWLNIPYYDGRSLVTDEWKSFKEDAFLDYGKEDKSNTYIYTAGSEGYLPKGGVEVGEKYHITIDLVPYVERALEKIQNHEGNLSSDYPLLVNTTVDDLRINQFYIGWEVPGTFSCGATIYKNSILYNKK